MENLVPCKMCMKNFNYSPGRDGAARQFCDSCRVIVDEDEVKRLAEETIVAGNRYLMDAPKRKDEYDPLDILIDGNMPEFESDSDRFVCALEMATFLNKTGLEGIDYLFEFVNHLGLVHRMIFWKNLSLIVIETCVKKKWSRPFVKEIMRVVI